MPSKGALRTLYQLAYISSGTAVGIATLCAEEKRRRAHILQTIADNAKRIRGSPRYIGNVAAARREEEVDQRDVRTTEMPSQVEEGYDQLVNRAPKRSRRKQASFLVEPPDKSKEQNHAEPPRTKVPTGPGVQMGSQKPRLVPIRYRPVDSRTVRKGTATLEKKNFRRDDRYPRFITPRLADIIKQPAKEQESAINAIAHDAEEFLATAPWTKERHEEIAVSDSLISLLARHAMLGDLTRVCKWKMANDDLSESNLDVLLESCQILKTTRTNKQRDLFDFYVNVLDHAHDARKVPKLTLLNMRVGLTAHWRVTGMSRSKVDQGFLGPVFGECSASEIQIVLARWCQRLLEDGLPDHARSTLTAATRLGLEIDDVHLPDVENRIFESALEVGQLACCAKLVGSKVKRLCHLRTQLSDQEHEDLRACLRLVERLATVCGERQAYHALSIAYGQQHHQDDAILQFYQWNVGAISPPARVALAMASLQLDPLSDTLFNAIHHSIPSQLQSGVEQARTSALIEKSWSDTRNLDFVSNVHQSCVQFATRVSNDQARVQSDLAMVRVYNAANRSDLAVRLLSKLCKDPSGSQQGASYAASIFAKQGAWKELDELFKIIESGEGLPWNGFTVRNINFVVQRYSSEHKAHEIWRFVTGLMNKIGLRPNQTTTQIMFRAFISDNEMSLIPRWADKLSAHGIPFSWNSEVAASLLTTFYRQRRPPHSLMMWLCRRLGQWVPEFDSQQFLDVLKEATSYDLRHGLLPRKARMNLERLDRFRSVSVETVQDPAEWDFEWDFEDNYRTGNGRSSTTQKSASKNQQILREMVTKLSKKDYQGVMDLYDHYTPSGLPRSLQILQVVIEASLRLNHGDISHAQGILDRARKAGMNVAGAVEPVLLHQLQRSEKKGANDIRVQVIDYYRYREENRLPITHRLGITAARALIYDGQAEHGLNLLNAIDSSGWAKEVPMNIVAFTVWAKGIEHVKRTGAGNLGSLVWVIKTVLANDLVIDRDFIMAIKGACLAFGMPTAVPKLAAAGKIVPTRPLGDSKSASRLLWKLYYRCMDRWAQQKKETYEKGLELIKIIARLAARDSEFVGDAAEQKRYPLVPRFARSQGRKQRNERRERIKAQRDVRAKMRKSVLMNGGSRV